jgi:hypothetical protein
VIACYLDESSDAQGKEVLTVAGFMQHGVNWFHLELLWNRILKRSEIDIPYFRATDCLNVSGVFAKFRSNPRVASPEERERCTSIRKELLWVIKECFLVGSGITIVLPDYYYVYTNNPDAKKCFNKDPFFTALHQEMVVTASGVRELYKDEKIAFVYDERKDISKKIDAAYFELKEKNPIWAKYFGSLSHMDDKTTPALQAADLLGSETRMHAQQFLSGSIGDGNDAFLTLKENLNFWYSGILNRQSMEAMIKENAPFDSERGRAIASIFPTGGLPPS